LALDTGAGAGHPQPPINETLLVGVGLDRVGGAPRLDDLGDRIDAASEAEGV
jgi:hypothetical protein